MKKTITKIICTFFCVFCAIAGMSVALFLKENLFVKGYIIFLCIVASFMYGWMLKSTKEYEV
jgi:hypothetical protein